MLLAALALLAIAADTSSVTASPYALIPAVDLPVLGAATALAMIAFIDLPPAACLPNNCDPSGENALDKKVLGNYSTKAHSVANYFVLSLVLVPLLADLLDSGGDGWATDTAIAVETLVVAQALTQLTKVAVRRNAPFVYNASVPLDVRTNDPDSTRSFFSGHTATSFAAASQYATTFWLRHPDSVWRFVVAGASMVLAATVGLLKIEAGYHFWTDIAAGALAGTSVGVLVPLLHANLEL